MQNNQITALQVQQDALRKQIEEQRNEINLVAQQRNDNPVDDLEALELLNDFEVMAVSIVNICHILGLETSKHFKKDVQIYRFSKT